MGARKHRTTADGRALPPSIYEALDGDGEPTGYKFKWREHDPSTGRLRARSKTFETLDDAAEFRLQVLRIKRQGNAVAKPDAASRLTLDELFLEWAEWALVGRSYTEKHVSRMARLWEVEVSPRIGGVRFGHLASDPGVLVEFSKRLDEPRSADAQRRGFKRKMGAETKRNVHGIVKAVITRARIAHPRVLTTNPALELLEAPDHAGPAPVRPMPVMVVERIREALVHRPARGPLRPQRDALFVSMMGEVVAARPSELLRVRWGDALDETIWLTGKRKRGQRARKLRAAWLPAAVRADIDAYRAALEARYGRQPDDGLVFVKLDVGGAPIFRDGVAVAWTENDYKRWTERCFRPALRVAAGAPEFEGARGRQQSLEWLATEPPRFYDLRHSAISVALRSKRWDDQEIADMSGHTRRQQSDTYAGVVREYQGLPPRDPDELIAEARAEVAQNPNLRAAPTAGPQRQQQTRRRQRKRDEQAQAIIEAYEREGSAEKAARALSLSETTVLRRLHEYGVSVRPRGAQPENQNARRLLSADGPPGRAPQAPNEDREAA